VESAVGAESVGFLVGLKIAAGAGSGAGADAGAVSGAELNGSSAVSEPDFFATFRVVFFAVVLVAVLVERVRVRLTGVFFAGEWAAFSSLLGDS
jgi:hypothetical protein